MRGILRNNRMGLGKGADPTRKRRLKLRDVRCRAAGGASDRLDNREGVLNPVMQLPGEENLALLGLVPSCLGLVAFGILIGVAVTTVVTW